jgi:hypothetical protein
VSKTAVARHPATADAARWVAPATAREEACGHAEPAAGLTLDELRARSLWGKSIDRRRPPLDVILADELSRGRIAIEGGRYRLVAEAFDAGVLWGLSVVGEWLDELAGRMR